MKSRKKVSKAILFKASIISILCILTMLTLKTNVIAAENIKLGAICSLSGKGSALGNEMANALTMAVEKINKKGGVLGKKVKLYIEDDASKKADGLIKAKKLAERDKVNYLIGILDTNISMPVQHYAKKRKIIYINTGSGTDILVKPPNCSKYFFKILPSGFMLNTGLTYTERKFGPDWAAVALDIAWGRHNVKSAKIILKEKGKVKWRKDTFIPFSENNYAPYLTPFVSRQPDVIYAVVFGPHYPRIIKQIRQMGIKSHIHCYFYSRPSALAAGEAALGMTASGWPVRNPKVPTMYPFAKEYYKKYKTYPGSHGASSYTGVDVLIRSVKNAGDVETEKVIKAMENLKFKDTMFGDFYFRKHDHQGVSPVFVGKVIKDKELRYGLKLEETIDNPTGFLVPDDPKSTGCKF